MSDITLLTGSDACPYCVAWSHRTLCNKFGIHNATPRQLSTAEYMLAYDPDVLDLALEAHMYPTVRRAMAERFHSLVYAHIPLWKDDLQKVLSFQLDCEEFSILLESQFQRSEDIVHELWTLYLGLLMVNSRGEDHRQEHDPYAYDSAFPLHNENVEDLHDRPSKKEVRAEMEWEYYTCSRFHGAAQNEGDDPHPFFSRTRSSEDGDTYPDDDKHSASDDTYWSLFIRGAESVGKLKSAGPSEITTELPGNVITRIGDVFLVDAHINDLLNSYGGLDMRTKVLRDQPSNYNRTKVPQNPEEPFRHVESRRSHKYVDGKRIATITWKRIHSELLSMPMRASKQDGKLVIDPHGDLTYWLGDPRGLDDILHHLTHSDVFGNELKTDGYKSYYDGRILAGPKYQEKDNVGNIYSFKLILRHEANGQWYTYLLIPVDQVRHFFALVREDAKFLIARLHGGKEKQLKKLIP